MSTEAGTSVIKLMLSPNVNFQSEPKKFPLSPHNYFQLKFPKHQLLIELIMVLGGGDRL